MDEIWAFVYSKQKNVPPKKLGEAGDVWTWVAIDADTKLVPTFHIGPRDLNTATSFMSDLAKRMSGRVQLTTDGLSVYLLAVAGAFKGDVDFAQLVKIYGSDSSKKAERRSPAVAAGVTDHVWKLDELIDLLEAAEATPIRRGSYKPRAISK